MGLGALSNVIEILSAALSGGTGGAYRQVILTHDTDKLILPVTPATYKVSTAQGNKTVGITQVGEALIFGMPKLQTLTLECFFPALIHDYPFVVGDTKSPAECVQQLIKWKETRTPIRVIITGTPVNMAMAIQTFDYREQDGSQDIYYTLGLTEYKDLNTPAANNDKTVDDTTGLKERADNTQAATSATLVQKGADVLDAAKKSYGQYSHWRRIVQSNDLKDLAINNISKLRKLVIKN
jgi:hypothetical protein